MVRVSHTHTRYVVNIRAFARGSTNIYIILSVGRIYEIKIIRFCTVNHVLKCAAIDCVLASAVENNWGKTAFFYTVRYLRKAYSDNNSLFD